jgi:hypothetical protein
MRFQVQSTLDVDPVGVLMGMTISVTAAVVVLTKKMPTTTASAVVLTKKMPTTTAAVVVSMKKMSTTTAAVVVSMKSMKKMPTTTAAVVVSMKTMPATAAVVVSLKTMPATAAAVVSMKTMPATAAAVVSMKTMPATAAAGIAANAPMEEILLSKSGEGDIFERENWWAVYLVYWGNHTHGLRYTYKTIQYLCIDITAQYTYTPSKAKGSTLKTSLAILSTLSPVKSPTPAVCALDVFAEVGMFGDDMPMI